MAEVLAAEQINWWFVTWSTDVLAAWGQTLGAAGTLVAVAAALRIAWKDREDRRREREDADAQVARRIRVDRYGGGPGNPSYKVKNNNADSVVDDVVITEVHATTREGHSSLGWKFARQGWGEQCYMGTLLPGQAKASKPCAFVWVEGTMPSDLSQAMIDVTVEFQDEAGRLWRRVGNGQPSRVRPRGKLARLRARWRLWWTFRGTRRAVTDSGNQD